MIILGFSDFSGNVQQQKMRNKTREFFKFAPNNILRYTIITGINNSTLLGSGTKTFGYEVFGKSNNLNQFNEEYYKSSYNSHNPFTNIWIEMGWVGLIATLIFVWLWYRQGLRGPPILFLPMLAVCIGQIFDYFVWEILFMAFQSFFFANFAVTITLEETG